MAGFFSGMTG